MPTLMEELTAIKAVEDKLTSNKVANFAYTDHAYNNPLTEADGVQTYDADAEQNVPIANASVLKVNPTILTKGWRAQASSITRMLMNHFLGRVSYNLNKVNDLFSLLLTNLMAFIGQPNGLATLDSEGKVALLNNVVNTGDTDIPTADSTAKFTAGGAYNFFGGQTDAQAWLVKVFSWAIGKLWKKGTGFSSDTYFTCLRYTDNMWLAGSTSNGLWYSSNGKNWARCSGISTTISIFDVYCNGDKWLAVGNTCYMSDDGVNWTSINFTSTGASRTCYAYGVWIITTTLNGIFWSDDNGVHWNSCTGVSARVKDISYINGVLIASTYSNGLLWSEDGKVWNQCSGVPSNSWTSIPLYENGIWVIGTVAKGMWWSEDGKAWTKGTGMSGTTGTTAFAYFNGKWIASAGNIWTSLDGKSWIDSGKSTGFGYSTVMLNADGILLLGGDEGISLYRSLDGFTWEAVTDLSGSSFLYIVYANNRIVTASYDGSGGGHPMTPQGIYWSDCFVAFES